MRKLSVIFLAVVIMAFIGLSACNNDPESGFVPGKAVIVGNSIVQ